MIHAQIGRYVEQSNSPMALLILEAAIGSLNAVPHGSQLDELISTLENVALESAHSDEVKESACRLIAAIVNKLPEGFNSKQIYSSSNNLMLNLQLRSRYGARDEFVGSEKKCTVCE